MRILYISKYAATPESGRPTRQYFLSKCLAEFENNVMLIYSNSNCLKHNGHDFSELRDEINGSLIIQKLGGPLITTGMNIKRIWSWIVFEYQLFINFRRIKNFQPEIIIVSSLSLLTFFYGVYLKKRLNRPLVIEVRDLYPLTLTELSGHSNYNPIVQFLGMIEKYGYRNADLILSSLENTKSYFEARRGSKVCFKWIPMGIDPDLYSSSPDRFTSEIIKKIIKLRSAGNFIIGYAGSIGKANALEEVLRLSFDPELVDKQIYFVIIGNGPLSGRYKEAYSDGNISFFDSVDKKYLPLVLRECDLLINTWLDKKIYLYGISPNKWIEYMFAERPILLACNGKSRIFNAADCGWQIPAEQGLQLKSELLKIYSFPRAVLDQKGKNGRDYLLSQLNYRRLSKELEESLQECINTF